MRTVSRAIPLILAASTCVLFAPPILGAAAATAEAPCHGAGLDVTVLDHEDTPLGSPIVGAVVMVTTTKDRTPITALTNASGLARFCLPETGHVSLGVVMDGYDSLRRSKVHVTSEATRTLTVYLDASPTSRVLPAREPRP
jgi:hypothetical protein